ncbi:MAG: GNAT family N-acetyltransferase [Butyricicoccus pullicaecorum]|nr:GNAT family N-acetyltransferase [Butyricicoccus pullicaecorum]
MSKKGVFKMDFKKKTGRIWLENQNGEEIAFVAFASRTEDTIEITSTVVDSSLRGQGVAGKLIDALTQELRSKGQKAIPTCSYAQKWFSQHPEHADLLAEES